MPLVRRRPLLRAAAIGGGAYYAGKRRQEAAIAKLERLTRLHEHGVLTDEEFARQKASLLGSDFTPSG